MGTCTNFSNCPSDIRTTYIIFYTANHGFILATPLGSAYQFFIRVNKYFIIIGNTLE